MPEIADGPSLLTARYERFLQQIAGLPVDAFVVTHPPNLRYLFNFSGSAGLALTLDGESTLIVDSRYLEQAGDEARNCRVVLASGSLDDGLRDVLSPSTRSLRIGLEADRISWERVRRLQDSLETATFVPAHNTVENLRVIKDSTEIANLETAFQIATAGLERTVPRILDGMTEIEIAGLLEYECRRAGSEGPAFETMVASGPRSSLPHAVAGARCFDRNELVLIDFGIRFRGYCSDMTRVFFHTRTPEPRIFPIVTEAQQAALSCIRPGVLSSQIDAAARDVIVQHGYGEYFGHGTGHGLGLEVHELPRISHRFPQEVQEGMVFTVEPGIYLPGRYGIRLEDAVVVTHNGFRLLGRLTNTA